MTNSEIKQLVIDKLFGRGIYTKQVNNVEYRTRCPFCGDSNNPNTGHLYIRINPEDNFPIVYNCFKCPSKGILRPYELQLLEIDDVRLKGTLEQMNRSSDKVDGKHIYSDDSFKFFDYKLPPIDIKKRRYCMKKILYMEDRFEKEFGNDEYAEMKLIVSLQEFLEYNGLNKKKLMCEKWIANMIEQDYVGFLSFGNSHILFRDVTGKHEEMRWIKYPITEESSQNKCLYSMATEINMITPEPVTLNIAEGVMDIIGARYVLGYHGDNVINIAVGGLYFNRVLISLLDLGLCGSNVTVNIFADNDEKFNPEAKIKTTVEYFRTLLKNYKYMYGSINIYHNMISKDIGVSYDNIILKKETL